MPQCKEQEADLKLQTRLLIRNFKCYQTSDCHNKYIQGHLKGQAERSVSDLTEI